MGSEPVRTAFRSPVAERSAELGGELPAGLAGPRRYPERKALATAAFRVCALIPRGPDTPGAGERYTGESTRHEPYGIEKPDLLLSQTGRPAPSIRGRGIKQFSPSPEYE